MRITKKEMSDHLKYLQNEDYDWLRESVLYIFSEFNKLTPEEKAIAVLDFNPATLDMGINLSARKDDEEE